MADAGFTKGPWLRAQAARDAGVSHPDWGCIYIIDPKDGLPTLIANAYSPALTSDGEMAECRSDRFIDGGWHEPAQIAANARLIAAAPELFEALQSIADFHIGDCPAAVEEVDFAKNINREIRKIARAALLKAEGK